MITTSRASSHQKSNPCGTSPSVEAHDDANATVIASATSSSIPGLRAAISSTAPVRNGRPPHR
ncbi:unannotated protein [freshwater metagenome]|uniref:Unannotated protein n=1 Tax=freshwater metagenome TaxID=449393 RepID=A0A6J7IN17_9ZZZZ